MTGGCRVDIFSAVYALFCLLVGWIGRERWAWRLDGFLFYFLLAVVITPPGAFPVLILMTPRGKPVGEAD